MPGSTTPYQTFGADPTGTPPFNIFGTVSPLRTSGIHYYSATIQQQVFKDSVITISYVGTKGQNLLYERSLNNRPLGCWSNATNPATGKRFKQLTGPANSATNPTSLNCDRPFDSVFQTNGVPSSITSCS